MGKVRFRKLKKLRHNPADLPSNEDVARAQITAQSEKQLPVISQLSSGKAEERTWACHSIANLVFDKPSLCSLVTGGVSSSIALLLVDKDHAVREAATGALRNLVAVGTDEFKDLIIIDDIVASLLACIKECSAALEQTAGVADTEKQVTARKAEWSRILENSLHSLSTMSELSQHVVDAVNNQNIVPLLFLLLQSHGSSSRIVKSVSWLCGHKEYLTLLESLLSSDGYSIGAMTLTGALVVGIFHNVYDNITDELKHQVLIAIIKELASILKVDIAVISANQMSPNQMSPTAETVDEINDVLSAHQLSLEVITNLCYEEDGDEENWEDMEEEIEIGANGSDEQNRTMSIEEDGSSPHLQMVAKLFNEQQIPQKVLQHCSPPKHNPGDFNSKVKAEMLERLCVVQCRALTALHALTPIVSIDDLGAKRNLTVIWNSLYTMATDKDHVQSNDEFLEALTGAQLAILEKLSSDEQSTECLSHDQIQWMYETLVLSGSHDPSVQVNVVKLVGVASRMMATDEQQNKHEAKVKLSTSQSLWAVCEAVDVMYNVYGSSVQLAELLTATGVITSLQHLATSFSERFKLEVDVLRQHPAHVIGVVEMVRDNLTNFIEYLKHPTQFL